MAKHSVMLIYCNSINASMPEGSGHVCCNKDLQAVELTVSPAQSSESLGLTHRTQSLSEPL